MRETTEHATSIEICMHVDEAMWVYNNSGPCNWLISKVRIKVNYIRHWLAITANFQEPLAQSSSMFHHHMKNIQNSKLQNLLAFYFFPLNYKKIIYIVYMLNETRVDCPWPQHDSTEGKGLMQQDHRRPSTLPHAACTHLPFPCLCPRDWWAQLQAPD